jgi:ribosome-binding protein aMBF1 (putative translation factor)
MICIKCDRKCNSIKSVIVSGSIIEGCENCISSNLQKGSGTTAAYYKREQQTKFRRDLTQPVEPREYIKAFGVDAARAKGFNDETIRKYSI